MKRVWGIVAVLLLAATVFGADRAAEEGETRAKPAGEPATAAQLKALRRDTAAADAAAAAGDWEAALRYVDYSGHEQEALARAMLEYGARQADLRAAVTDRFGKKGWTETARTLRLPERSRRGKTKRSGRVVDGVLFVGSTEGAGTEVPYVEIDGVWKLSIRDVVYLALRKAGVTEEVEEAVLYAVAGKTAKVLEARNAHLADLTAGVRAERFGTVEELKQAAQSPAPEESGEADEEEVKR